MAETPDRYEFREDTDIEFTNGYITEKELGWLRSSGVLRKKGHRLRADDDNTNQGEITRAELNVKKLAQIAFEYELLDEVASSVETDILETFEEATSDVLTTAQISDTTGRPKSSVSRALSRLVEKDKLMKVQDGVYQVPPDLF